MMHNRPILFVFLAIIIGIMLVIAWLAVVGPELALLTNDLAARTILAILSVSVSMWAAVQLIIFFAIPIKNRLYSSLIAGLLLLGFSSIGTQFIFNIEFIYDSEAEITDAVLKSGDVGWLSAIIAISTIAAVVVLAINYPNNDVVQTQTV